MRTFLSYCILLLFPACLFAQSEETLRIRTIREQRENVWLQEYIRFLSIPNIAADKTGLHRNATFIMQMMQQRNIQRVQLLSDGNAATTPAIYGEVMVPGATQTLIFYAHYDGQPVDSSQWARGLKPFVPKLVKGSLEQGAAISAFPSGGGKYDPDWRIYARGASDDKAGIMAILNAYEAVKRAGLPLSYNIKFFFEGEEEAGSPNLAGIFDKHKELLKSDLWVICDGPVHQSGKKAILFGARGDAHVDITLYGATRPLHSGHYGNWAPNPGLLLAKLLASMKDDKGRVTIRGFYDDVIPLTEQEKKALRDMPPVGNQLKEELHFVGEEMPGVDLGEAIMLPSLNINGMQSGNTGAKASNVIPTTATAVLDLRMVPGNDYKKQQDRVINHIREQGYYITEEEPTDAERAIFSRIARVKKSGGYNAQRTPMDLPVVQNVIEAVRSTTADKVVLIPTMGGSLPLFLFEKHLKAKTITVPVANHDNNQHAENENIRIRNLWNGIETMAAIMTVLPGS